MSQWPFPVTEGKEACPVTEVDYKGESKQFFAEEISSMVLKVRVVRIRRGFLMFVTWVKVTPSFTKTATQLGAVCRRGWAV
jgi:hypothetical protein